MMTELIKTIKGVTGAEHVRACAAWGDTFASLHEGYGVIAEEVQEADDESRKVASAMGALMRKMRWSRIEDIEAVCHLLEDAAVLAACEYVQVAAMARKMVHTLHKEAGT